MNGCFDSTGKIIFVGDRVRYVGHVYTIKNFIPNKGRLNTSMIEFEETDMLADELSVDKVDSFVEDPHVCDRNDIAYHVGYLLGKLTKETLIPDLIARYGYNTVVDLQRALKNFMSKSYEVDS